MDNKNSIRKATTATDKNKILSKHKNKKTALRQKVGSRFMLKFYNHLLF